MLETATSCDSLGCRRFSTKTRKTCNRLDGGIGKTYIAPMGIGKYNTSIARLPALISVNRMATIQ